MLTEQRLLSELREAGAVLTDSHFVYTSGAHGTAYLNMRKVAPLTWWLAEVGDALTGLLDEGSFDYLIGPETLGRTLATVTATALDTGEAIWCDIVGTGEERRAAFPSKMDFHKLVSGRRFVIVDDLLTTGSSINKVAALIRQHDGEPVMGVAVVRRTPDVSAENCGVPDLKVLADVPGFVTFSPEECVERGPCSRRVPVVLRPGHGHEWIKDHPDYPTV